MTIYECYKQLNNIDYKELIEYKVYYFKFEYIDISLYKESLQEFQKFIMQQTEPIDGYIAPCIYIIYEKQSISKKLKHSIQDWPKIEGYIFINSIIHPKNFYKIYHGMKRYNVNLTMEQIFENNLANNLENNYFRPSQSCFPILKCINKRHDEIIRVIENYNNPIILVCEIYKFYKSKGERKCHEILSKNKYITKIESQYIFLECTNINPLPFDFKCTLKNKDFFLVEFQGEQHFKSIKMWGGDEGLENRKLNDQIKKQFCDKNKIKLLTINYNEYKKIDNIINEYIKTLNQDDTSEIGKCDNLEISINELVPQNIDSNPINYWTKFIK